MKAFLYTFIALQLIAASLRAEDGFFEPKLKNGCVVEAAEYAWLEQAARKLPKEAMPRLLIVCHENNVSHGYTCFKTPRGTWFAYNPSGGSKTLLEGDMKAMDWGKQLEPNCKIAFFEDFRKVRL